MFLGTGEATSGAPGPVQAPQYRGGHRLTGARAVKGHKDDEGIGAAVV